MPGFTIDWGDAGALTDPSYAAFGTYPGFVATSALRIDQAARCTLRVKRWKLQVTYLLETGHSDSQGTFVAKSSQTLTPSVTSTSILHRSGGSSVDSEADLYTSTLGALWGFTGDDIGGTLLTTMWLNAAGDLAFTFSLLLNIVLPDNAGVFGTSTGDTDDGPPLVTFLGQTWAVLPGANQPGMYFSGDPDSSTAYRMTLQGIKVDPDEYWSYGGMYNTSTGGPA